MLRIAVCDDEEFVCSALESYIISSCDFLHIVVEIDLFSSGSGLKNILEKEMFIIYYFWILSYKTIPVLA